MKGRKEPEPEIQHPAVDDDLWHVYMVCCNDGTLYTGIARDLDKRVAAHNSEKDGARYTRSRRPVYLVYSEEVRSRAAASRREHRIKKLPRDKKMRLVKKNSQKSCLKLS